MSHTLMNLFAIWTIAAGTPMEINETLEAAGTPSSGFIVIDRMDETTMVVETQAGMLELPREVFPVEDIHEGMVIEWHVNDEEEAYRLQEAQARIDRMRNTLVVQRDKSLLIRHA